MVFLAGGCGFEVQQPDLFLLTRTGQGGKLTMLVNYGGTISCNGGPQKQIPDSLLIQARDLGQTLDSDAQAKLDIPNGPHTVYSYSIKLPDGTIHFPDSAGAQHSELAQIQLLALQLAQGPCGLS